MLAELLVQPCLKDLILAMTPDPLMWKIPSKLWLEPEKYLLALTVWCRINLSHVFLQKSQFDVYRKNKLLQKKIQLFQNNHLAIALQLERDGYVLKDDLAGYYTSLTKEIALLYDDARDNIRVEKKTHVLRETPLEIIEREFPDQTWRLENTPPDVERAREHYDPLYPVGRENDHQLYYVCLTIMAQCAETYESTKLDALYFYYLAFVDLFFFCLGQPDPDMSDSFLVSRLDEGTLRILDVYYPHDTRVFTCWDLPDLSHVLYHIPLAEEQLKPRTIIEKYIKKSLPFCCQRRTFVDTFTKTLHNKAPETVIIQKLVWCMLANAYPDTKKVFDMRRLLRVRQICTDIPMLEEAFSRERWRPENQDKAVQSAFKKETFRGCEVIINAYRLWIYAMVYRNKYYQEYAGKYLSWDPFVKHTFSICELCQQTDIYGEDAFALVRSRLSSMRLKNSQVQRYKKGDEITFVLRYLKEALEKDVFRRLYWLRQAKEKLDDPHVPVFTATKDVLWLKESAVSRLDALRLCQTVEPSLTEELPIKIKQNILNVLLRVPAHERLTPLCLGILQLPEYGGMQENTLLILMALFKIYDTTGKPQRMRQYIQYFDSVYEIKLLTWYLTVVWRLNHIRVAPLDAPSVRGVHRAFMQRKYKLAPGQKLSPKVYEICVSICCKRILANCGTHGYGNHSVYYDTINRVYLCNKSYKGHVGYKDADGKGKAMLTDNNDTVQPKQKKRKKRPVTTENKTIQQMRKKFAEIPCKNNPVLRINLEGRMLVYGISRNKLTKFTHCPRCAAFHEYEWQNWAGSPDGRYRCRECRESEITTNLKMFRCFHCENTVPPKAALRCQLEVFSDDLEQPFRYVYFCEKHYNLAKKYNHVVPENELRPLVKKAEEKKRLRQAKRF